MPSYKEHSFRVKVSPEDVVFDHLPTAHDLKIIRVIALHDIARRTRVFRKSNKEIV
jgi:hypothetical protein